MTISPKRSLPLIGLLLILASLAAAAAKDDPLPAGSEWKGHTSRQDKSAKSADAWIVNLKVTRRKGDAFQARLITHIDDEDRIVEVEGTTSDNRIAWKVTKIIKGTGGGTVGKGSEGTIENNKITATFERRDKHGHLIQGSIELTRKDSK
jgi:hypothetical protein